MDQTMERAMERAMDRAMDRMRQRGSRVATTRTDVDARSSPGTGHAAPPVPRRRDRKRGQSRRPGALAAGMHGPGRAGPFERPGNETISADPASTDSTGHSPPAPADPDSAARRRGIALVAIAGVFWSLQSLAIRAVDEAEPSQIVFWRSASQLIAMLGVVAVVNRGHVVSAFRRAGVLALVGGVSSLVAGTCFVFSLVHTTVANVVFIMASSPLFAAAGGWLVMRERLPPRTLGAMLVALLGIGVMMWEGLATGAMAGYAFALVTTIGFAGIAVVARRGGGTDMLPMVCWGAGFTVVISYFLSDGMVALSASDTLACVISGGVLTTCGATCFMHGARYVPAGVLAFLTLTEVVLAPLWVWAAFSETPSGYTLAGGTVVLGAILAEALSRTRRRPG